MKQSICLVEDPFKIRLTPDSQKLSSYWLIQPICDEFVGLFNYLVFCFFLHLFVDQLFLWFYSFTNRNRVRLFDLSAQPGHGVWKADWREI